MARTATIVRRVLIVLLLIGAAVGTLLWARQTRTVNVGSLVGGRVVRVLTDEGQPVQAGQTIVELETETLDRQIAEQTAAIAAARAALEKGIHGPLPQEISKAAAAAENDEKERKRLESLYHAGIASREMYDAAATTARMAAEDLRLLQLGTRKEDLAQLTAQLDQQQHHLASLQKQRDECRVMSTVTGVVQSFGLRPGLQSSTAKP